ncbi:MAG TPA: pilus assembly protein TadG-related protein, partial [Ilumatobacteraceae bacterium]|nr:pilus assembly protein TadG-related protein [Ilumatobacteraceae bacterium]
LFADRPLRWRGSGKGDVDALLFGRLAGRISHHAGVVHRAQSVAHRRVGTGLAYGDDERHPADRPVPAMTRPDRDRGAISVVMVILLVMVLGGAGLVVDGGRALVARRHASNTAEAAARAAVASATPLAGFDGDAARDAAFSYAVRAGVPVGDVRVVVGVDFVTVTIIERRSTVFLILGGQETVTVQASGTARVTYTE